MCLIDISLGGGKLFRYMCGDEFGGDVWPCVEYFFSDGFDPRRMAELNILEY